MSTRLKPIGQLDALRAFAALSVVVFHFLPEYGIGHFPVGWAGVDLFFAISGYLITAILLQQKEPFNNKLLIIRNFIIKRVLRLFPAYYLFITFFLIIKLCTTLYVWDNGEVWFFYTYTQNILYFFEGFKAIQLNHLWSLSIEEQFYLFWPWIVLFVPNRNLLYLLLFIIPASILINSMLPLDTESLRMLPTSHIHTLGTGALMAVIQKLELLNIQAFMSRLRPWVLLITMAILITESGLAIPQLLLTATIMIFSGFIITGCYEGFNGIPGRLLNLAPLQYIGKISYGIYLYHKPVPWFVNLVCTHLQISLNKPLVFTFSVAGTLLIAHLSYRWIEIRFLRMKSRFDL